MKGAFRKLRSFRNEWKDLRDRSYRDPSRKLLHRLRRSCRKWQAVLALVGPGKPSPVCRRVGKDLRRCLRRSRAIRNADVMQKFLRENKLDLTLPFFDKKERSLFCRSLRKIGPGRKKDFRKCTKYLVLEFEKEAIGDKIDLAARQMEAFDDLAKAYESWSRDPAHDFSSLHQIRIRLKKISGQGAFLKGLPGMRAPLPGRQKRDLKCVLRHLGKMSDLILLEMTVPELKGTRAEKERLEHRLSECLMKSGKEIEAILGKVPEESPGGKQFLNRK